MKKFKYELYEISKEDFRNLDENKFLTVNKEFRLINKNNIDNAIQNLILKPNSDIKEFLEELPIIKLTEEEIDLLFDLKTIYIEEYQIEIRIDKNDWYKN